jgi:hypothetical protein
MLFQCFVGIDNTSVIFLFLYAFFTSELARIIWFLLTILQDHFFYDCLSFAVIASDFSKGLSATIAQKAAQDTKDTQAIVNTKQRSTSKDKGKEVQRFDLSEKLRIKDSLPTTPEIRPKYKLNSQTIIINWVKEVQPVTIGLYFNTIILQFCK